MTSTKNADHITYPIPISRLGERYYVFNLNHVTHLRAAHNIPGMLTGTLPQSPQQNVFMGLPLQLMPEEARLLVETGVGRIVDDVAVHHRGLDAMSARDRREWNAVLRAEGREAARLQARQADERQAATLGQMSEERRRRALEGLQRRQELQQGGEDEDQASEDATDATTPHLITPTTSHPPLPPPAVDEEPLPRVPHPPNYTLYRHLHDLSYFLTPGLRFGAPYTVYPGDPLRFHSHFLAQGFGWDEEVPLRRVVGGGRLGTGVKKGFLLGGADDEGDKDVRCFCVEWAGM